MRGLGDLSFGRLRCAAAAFVLLPATLSYAQVRADLVVQRASPPDGGVLSESADGRLILTGAGSVVIEPGEDLGQKDIATYAVLWDAASGRELRELRGHTKPVICAAISPDDAMLLTVSDDRTARLWSAATGRELARLDTRGLHAISCTWASAGIVLGEQEGGIRLFAGPKYRTARNVAISRTAIEDLAYSPDGKTLALADGRHLILWNPVTGSIRTAGNAVGAVLWSLDGNAVYAMVRDHSFSRDLEDDLASKWDVKTLKRLDEQSSSVLMWPPDLTKANDGTDPDKPKSKEEEPGTSQWMFSPIKIGAAVRFAAGGQSLLIFSESDSDQGSSVALWGLNTGKPLEIFPNVIDPFDAESADSRALCLEPSPADWRHPQRAAFVAFVVDPLNGQTLTSPALRSACTDFQMSKATTDFGHALMAKYDLNGNLGAVSPDRRYFVAQESDAAYIRESATGRLVAMCMGQATRFSRDGTQLLCNSEVPHVITLQGWDSVTAGAPKLALNEHVLEVREGGKLSQVNGVESFLSDAKSDRLLLRTADGSVRVLTLSTLQQITTLMDVPPDALLGQSYDDWKARYRTDAAAGLTDEVWKRSFRAEGISASFSATGNLVAVAGRLGAYLFSGKTGERLASLYRFGDDGWAVVTPNGRFDTNQLDGKAPLHWVASDTPLMPLPLEIFLRDYYTPGLLARVLRGDKSLAEVRSIAEIKNRVQPDVKVVSVTPLGPGRVEVLVHAASHKDEVTGQESGLNDLRLFRDGQLVADGLRTGALESRDYIFHNVMLRGDDRDVIFTAYAFNSDRIKSTTASLPYKLTPTETKATGKIPGTGSARAFLLQIGVNRYKASSCDLRDSAADALRLSTDLSERLAGRYQVKPVMLTSVDGSDFKEAGKQKIHAQLDAIAAEATPDDVFFLSFSGHGYSAPDGKFYILPSDIAGSCHAVDDKFLEQAISADELADWLRPIDAGEMTLILDACFSAESVEAEDFKPGPMGSRGLGQLAYDKRMRVLAASQSDDVAHEYEYLGQGLLTYVLTHDGLQEGKADWRPIDQKIMVGEWLAFAADSVPKFVPAGATKPSCRAAGDRFGGCSAKNFIQVPALFDFSIADRLELGAP